MIATVDGKSVRPHVSEIFRPRKIITLKIRSANIDTHSDDRL